MIQEGTERSLREERARNERGTRAATSSQTADARTHGSRCLLAGGGNNRRGPDKSGHRLPLEARGSHARRSRSPRWQTGTPCQSASPRITLAGVAVSGDLAGGKQPIARRTARAVGSAAEHQSPQCRSSSAWMEQRSQPGGKKIREACKPTLRREPEGCYRLPAAHETGLLCDLETAIAPCEPTTARSLLSSSPRCLRQLLLTLLFFPLGNLHRTHDLRSSTGNVLAVLTGRSRAYGD